MKYTKLFKIVIYNEYKLRKKLIKILIDFEKAHIRNCGFPEI